MSMSDFEALKGAIVSILGKAQKPIGGGVLVPEKHVVTCAHVVNQALDLADDSQPQPDDSVKLTLRHIDSAKYVSAKVVAWRPIDENGGGDIAILETLEPLPSGVQCQSLKLQAEFWGKSFRVYGFPPGNDDGTWAEGKLMDRIGNTDYVQLDGIRVTGQAVRGGFSGNAVWSETENAVVGIIATAERNENKKVSYMIPTALLKVVWPRLLGDNTLVNAPVERVVAAVGGTIKPDSPFYVGRSREQQGLQLITEGQATLTIEGAFQVGKSTLLARLMKVAKAHDKKLAYINCQELISAKELGDEDAFYRTIFREMSRSLGIPDKTREAEYWGEGNDDSNLARAKAYMQSHLLPTLEAKFMLAFDEANRLYAAPFASDFFGMLRSWHENRANFELLHELWHKVDIMAIVIATSADSVIDDPKSSPFNVATQIQLEDFNQDNLAFLNGQYGNCLTDDEVARLYDLTRGHPFLSCLGLYWVASKQGTAEVMFERALEMPGPFSRNLGQLESLVNKRENLKSALFSFLHRREMPDRDTFYQLHRAGIVIETNVGFEMRNPLYKAYFSKLFTVN